jgi:hypothetical protein
MTDATPQLPDRSSIDIGGMVQFVFNDPDWWRTAIPHGLCIFIPIVGPVINMGWQRRMFLHVRDGGEGLLPLDFGEDLRHGVAPFVATFSSMMIMMVAFFVLLLPGIGFAALGAVLEVEALAGLGALALIAAEMAFLPLTFAFALLMLEVLRRSYHGEMVPLLSPGESIQRIRSRPTDYLLTLIGQFVASFIGSIGIYACFVGGIVSLPAGNAMTANVLAQWDRLSTPVPPRF